MPAAQTISYQQAENLQQEFNAVLYAYGNSLADPHAVPRAESRLFDACLDLGMDYDVGCHVEWAAEQITDAMVSL